LLETRTTDSLLFPLSLPFSLFCCRCCCCSVCVFKEEDRRTGGRQAHYIQSPYSLFVLFIGEGCADVEPWPFPAGRPTSQPVALASPHFSFSIPPFLHPSIHKKNSQKRKGREYVLGSSNSKLINFISLFEQKIVALNVAMAPALPLVVARCPAAALLMLHVFP